MNIKDQWVDKDYSIMGWIELESRAARAKIAIFILGIICIVAEAEAGRSADECIRISPQLKPKWAFSGGWIKDGYGIVLADSGRKTLLRYDLGGYLLGDHDVKGAEVALDIPGKPQDSWPSFLKPATYGFLVEYHEGFMVKLDGELNFLSAQNVVNEPNVHGHHLASVVQWQPVGSDKIVGFGDVKKGSANWVSAFVVVDMTDPQDFRILEEMDIYDDARTFYYLGFPFIASSRNQEEIFYFRMEKRPVLRAEAFDRRTMRELRWVGFPAVDRRDLPKNSLANVAALYGEVARSSIPVALFSWRSKVVVVERRVQGSNSNSASTEWYLSEAGSGPGNQVKLPIFGAEHLTVIPGERFWAFIEKGPVNGLADQSISTFSIVPARYIDAALSSASEQVEELCAGGIR